MSYLAELRTERREDRRLEIDAQLKLKQLDAEEARKDAAEQRRLKQLDRRAREQEKERKKDARRARRLKIGRWLNANPVTVFVGYVMVSSIVPAVISQVAALSHAGVFILLAVLLASMLEGGAWALTFMGKQAEDAGRPAGKYRAGTWGTAFAAAAVQYWHWSEALPAQPWVAAVFAGSSLFAIWLWDMKTHGSHGKTREQRREEKARRRHVKRRRKLHGDIVGQAEWLQTALPFGELDDDAAFAAAWRIKKGAEPALDADTYASLTNAQIQLGAAFELGEHVRPELVRTGMLAAAYNPLKQRLNGGPQVLGETTQTDPRTAQRDTKTSQVANQVPPAVLRPVDGATSKVAKVPRRKPTPPRRRPGDTPRFHTAARAAAAETARRTTVTARAD
ncbi:hypothetical protein [Streptomyces sp. NPDC003720]|uniref:hypothetical protein n=1 Tax=Streptomyces sp. NPDC003720 TaxID=3364684 RepID=UPI0036C33EE9